MSWASANYGYWEFWAPYDPENGFYGEHKCIFDGINKLIYVNPNIAAISVKEDLYSDWKEWVQVRDHAKFPPAIRTTGGDPIGGGEFTGDVYFLINDWRMIIDHSLDIDGVIYSDNFPSPFVQVEGTQIVTNKVSSLVSVIAPQVEVGGITVPTVQEIRQEMDSNSTKLTAINSKVQTLNNGPTAVQIRQEMDTNSIKLELIKTILESMDVPTVVQIRQEIDANSVKLTEISNKADEALTKTEFLALQ